MASEQIIVSLDCEWRFCLATRQPAWVGRRKIITRPASCLTLMQRDVASIAVPDSILFMWATAPMLVEAICVAEAWVFSRVLYRDLHRLLSAARQAKEPVYITEWAWL